MNFSGRTLLATSILLAVAIGSLGYFSVERTQVPLSLGHLTSGVQTCFFRVHQSFTAKVLGQGNSSYLQSDFLDQTEECFADAMGLFRDRLEWTVPAIEGPLNELITEVHWFQDKLQGSSTFATQSNGLEGLGERFTRIESYFDKALSSIGKYSEVTEAKSYRYFVVLFTFIALSSLILIFVATKLSSMWNNLNHIRENIYKYSQGNKESYFEVTGTLDKIGISSLVSLLKEVGEDLRDMVGAKVVGRPDGASYDTSNSMPLASQNTKESEEVIEKIWQEATGSISNSVDYTESLQLIEGGHKIEESLNGVLDVLSPKIVTTGTVVNLDFQDDLETSVDAESLEQAFYHLLDLVINDANERNLTLRLVKEDQNAAFELICSGSNIQDFQTLENRPLSLQIVHEILNELDVAFTSKNMNASNGDIVGVKFNFLIPAKVAVSAQNHDSNRRLRSVRKGSKKELMRELNS